MPAAQHRTEEEIRRSRFITTLAHAPTVEEARAVIATVSREFGDASHNCWAYVVGPPGSTSQVGMSDDGEPHGTAGRPMLTVLLHSGVGEIVAVVTRYFGGTLLGKGGLVKAYSGGVQYALETLPLGERVEKVTCTVVIDYASITLFQRMLPDYEVEILDEVYAADVSYRLELPAAGLDAFSEAVVSLTNGQALIGVDYPPIAS
ncbi:MAG: YigZ family protein [Caldilineaceae bacterium]|nr:YigZ family protein [Caldilineaceae bacterium]MBP8107959.1 YigZ family protein [Caldilineaceae bacterium]MBP8125525.1 YigZ family protein [Caldilineaceae bacterium]MBP9073032.1 YigZ family protein [Caldilineaceae bacterium]